MQIGADLRRAAMNSVIIALVIAIGVFAGTGMAVIV